MWAGETVAILASGESMSPAVAQMVRIYGCRTIAVNNTWKLAPWADILYAADAAWWNHYHGMTFKGLKVALERTRFDDVLCLRNTGRTGFDPDPACVRTGGNSGYQSIHVAAHAGAARILLCGFDMRGSHWHGKHVHGLRDHGEGIFAEWLERMETLKAPLAERGIEVVNCTPGSALKVWPNLPLEEVLASVVPVA
jgi:hypothetical protein